MSHYSLAFQPEEMIKNTNSAADYVQKVGGVPVLLYSGMSGVAHATALQLELHRRSVKVFMAYIRKPYEESHGSRVQTDIPYSYSSQRDKDAFRDNVVFFVDDFVASGATRDRCLKALRELQYYAPVNLSSIHVLMVNNEQFKEYRPKPKPNS